MIQGHEHAYARTCMLYKGECVDGGGSDGGVSGGNGGLSASSEQPAGQKGGRPLTEATVGTPKPHRRLGAELLQEQQQQQQQQQLKQSSELRPPRRAPVYILAGNAGAGFTHGFPKSLPDWVVVAFEVRCAGWGFLQGARPPGIAIGNAGWGRPRPPGIAGNQGCMHTTMSSEDEWSLTPSTGAQWLPPL